MRRFVWLALPAAGTLFTALALPSSGATSADRTAPHGPLGVTTVGMGTGPSYGEPSFSWAPDGRHAIICTPGGNKSDGSTVVKGPDMPKDNGPPPSPVFPDGKTPGTLVSRAYGGRSIGQGCSDASISRSGPVMTNP